MRSLSNAYLPRSFGALPARRIIGQDQVLAIVVEAALKEVDADGVELLFRPPGSKELGKRLGLGRDGPLRPLLANVKQLEDALADLGVEQGEAENEELERRLAAVPDLSESLRTYHLDRG